MEKEDRRKEYVLEDFGYVWKGFLREVPWTFGQVTSKMDDTRPYPFTRWDWQQLQHKFTAAETFYQVNLKCNAWFTGNQIDTHSVYDAFSREGRRKIVRFLLSNYKLKKKL